MTSKEDFIDWCHILPERNLQGWSCIPNLSCEKLFEVDSKMCQVYDFVLLSSQFKICDFHIYSTMYKTRFYFIQLFVKLVSPNFKPFCVTIRNTCLLPYIHSKKLWATLAHLQIWLPSTVRRSQRLGCCKPALCHVQYVQWGQWQINFDFLSSWQRRNW